MAVFTQWWLLAFLNSCVPYAASGSCIFSKLGNGDATRPLAHGLAVGVVPDIRPLGRSLQQSNGACELTLNNNTLTFAACQSLQPTLTADYNLLYTITTPADEAGPVLHGAIDAVTPGWAGFGIPAEAEEMVGASAIIVKACANCPTGASVDSYFLGGYDSSAVQPPGKFKVLSMQAQASTTGRLQAYFEVVLTQKANALKATPLDVIYAVGEVSKEEIQAHQASQGVADRLTLTSAFSTQSPNATAASPPAANSTAPASSVAASPSAAAAPAAVPAAPVSPVPLAGMNSSGGGVNASSASGAPASIEGTPSTNSPSPAAANSIASGCTLQSTEGATSYSLCEELLPNSAAKLYWTLDTSSSPVVLTGAMEASTTGWLGFGFPAVAGQMQGGNAVIAKPCSTCPSGASIDSYFLGGYSSNQVTAPGQLAVPQMNASLQSGRLYAQFVMQLPQTAQELATGVPIISAQGPVSADGELSAHALSNSIAQSVNFGTGSTIQQGLSSDDHDSKVHGILMVVGFGILVPIGVLVARTLKPLDPLWFHLHRIIQVLGLCLGIAGFGLGLHLGNKGGGQAEYDHKAIGYTVVAGALVQLLFGVARVQKGARWRLQWAWFHRLLGVSVVLLACGNAFLGLHIGKPAGTHKFVAGYIAFLATILALAVAGTAVNEYRAWTVAKPRPLLIGGRSQGSTLFSPL